MIFLNFFIGIFVLCLLAGGVQSDNFESNLKVSLSGAVFDDVSADDATNIVADELTTDAIVESNILEEGSNELPEEAAVELNYLGEPEINILVADPLENNAQFPDAEIRNDPTIAVVEEVTVSLDNFEDPPSSPSSDQTEENDETYQSLATAYQQITKDTEVIRSELEDARNRLIAYLEADIVRVAKDEMKEAELRELIAKYEETIEINASLRSQINDLYVQVEGITPVESVNDQEFKVMKVEHQKLKIFHDDLARENEELRSELVQLRNRVVVPTDESMQEIAAQNEALSSQLAESKEVINSLTASLDSSEEASKSLAAKLTISKNIVTVEQLSTENAKLELDVVTRESTARINKLEKELKVSLQQLKVKNLAASGSSVSADSESVFSRLSASLFEVAQPYTSTVLQLGGAGLVGVLAFQEDILEKLRTPVTEAFAGLKPYYDIVAGHLSPYVTAAFAGASDVIEVIEGYYNDTISPLVHDTVLPEMSKMNSKATNFISAKWSAFKEFYSVNIHAPASDLYEAHLAVHVNTVSGNVKELYDNNLKDFVDSHIAPRWIEVLASAGVLLAAVNLPQVPGNLFKNIKQYHSSSVTFLKANETVRNIFGDNTDNVVTFFAKLVTAFMAYILLQLVLTFVASITTGPKRRKSERTHGEEKASIRFMRKGSQEHIDIKEEHDKEVIKVGDAAAGNIGGKDVSPVTCKIDGSLLGDKTSSQCLSPLRVPRPSNLPSKNSKGPNSPYSGIPLSKTGG